MKIAVISGGFDPIHSGHISYIKTASEYGEKLVVLLNSDEWLINKKERFFMPFSERKEIVQNLKFVDKVIGFEDDSIGSCINGLLQLKKDYPDDEIIFCNGGDRNKGNIPEMSVSNVSFEFSVGGNEKLNSSSWILKKWTYPMEERIWGQFFDLFKDENIKVKELVVNPGKGMSFQRHQKRNEFWIVTKGACDVKHSKGSSEEYLEKTLHKHDSLFILQGHWHQIVNPYSEICHIVEIQYGDETSEEDIERLYFYDEKP
jgi:cytidyltransferase-like protein